MCACVWFHPQLGEETFGLAYCSLPLLLGAMSSFSLLMGPQCHLLAPELLHSFHYSPREHPAKTTS